MDIKQMRKRFRELNMPGVVYNLSSDRENYLIEYKLKKEKFFEENRVYSILNSEVETLLEEVINNDNARFFFGVKRDEDFQLKYDSLIKELEVRRIEYIR
jgi:hypothetical protein